MVRPLGKVCSQSRPLMRYHSTMAVLYSIIIAVSGEEPEVQVGKEVVWTRHGLEDNVGCVLTDSYVDSGPHRREGRRMRRAKRGCYCKALLDWNSG